MTEHMMPDAEGRWTVHAFLDGGILRRCEGCAGCAIRNALDERDTFTRAEVARLMWTAFRSGSTLAVEMSEDIVRWAAEPPVRRNAEAYFRRRRAEMDESAARQRARDVAAADRRGRIHAGWRTGIEDDGTVVRVGGPVDPDCEWPEPVTPGSGLGHLQ